MKTRLLSTRKIKFAAALLFVAANAAFAQMPNLGLGNLLNLGGGSMGTDFATLTKIFGDHTGFTAQMGLKVLDKNGREKTTAPMEIIRLGDKMRLALDTEKLMDPNIPGGGGAMLKQLNIDRIVFHIRPDQDARYVVLPGLQLALKNAITADEKADLAKKAAFEITALGKETIDGHACVKNKYVGNDSKGTPIEYTVWNATDLKNFPVQISTKEKSDTVILHYKDIKLTKPDAKEFDLPAGVKEFADYKELLQAVMVKMMNDAAAAVAPAEKPATTETATKPEKAEKAENSEKPANAEKKDQ